MTIDETIAQAHAKAAELDTQIAVMAEQLSDITAQRDLFTAAAVALEQLAPEHKAVLDSIVSPKMSEPQGEPENA